MTRKLLHVRIHNGAKIADMSETWTAMRHAATEQFGSAYQASIFGGGF